MAILQKCSVKESVVSIYLEQDIISWVLNLVSKSFKTKIHMFCLDFATAMLANVVHSKWCQISLTNKAETVINIMDSILRFIR